MATDVRHSNSKPVDAKNFLGDPLSSDVPSTDNEGYVYNSTSGYYELQPISTTDGDQTFTGDVTLNGRIRIGPSGTWLSELEYGIINTNVTGTAIGASVNQTSTFQSAFDDVPDVQLLGYSPNDADAAMTMVVRGTPTVSSFQWSYTNENPAVLVGPLMIHYVAYR